MRTPSYTRQFERDLRRMRKRGKDIEKIKVVMGLLTSSLTLGLRFAPPLIALLPTAAGKAGAAYLAPRSTG